MRAVPRHALSLIPTAMMASTAVAVPPPPSIAANQIALKTDNCPVMLAGTARPYSPVAFRFQATASNLLVLALGNPNPRLMFDLTVGEGARVISGAGFGAGDVWITLPSSGTYTLSVSSLDPVALTGTAADFEVKAYLRDAEKPGGCPR